MGDRPKHLKDAKWLDIYEGMVKKHPPSFEALGYNRDQCMSQYRALRNLLPVRRGDKILDLGCGFGHGLFLFADCSWTGIDACEAYIDVAKKMHGASADIHRLSAGDLDRPDYEGEWDCVVMAGIFNFGYEWFRVKKVLDIAWKVCTKGMAVGFLFDPPRLDKEHTIWPMGHWVMALSGFSPAVRLDATWGREQAAIAVLKGV